MFEFKSLHQREVSSCFSLEIPLWVAEEEIADYIRRDARIKAAVKQMLDGKISIADLFELIEGEVPGMDLFQDELETNLEILLQSG